MPRTPSVTRMQLVHLVVIHHQAAILTMIDDACNLSFLLAQHIEPLYFLCARAARPCLPPRDLWLHPPQWLRLPVLSL